MIDDGVIKIKSKKDYEKYFPKPKSPYVKSSNYANDTEDIKLQLEISKILINSFLNPSPPIINNTIKKPINRITISNHHMKKPKSTKTTWLEIYKYKNIQLRAENRLLRKQLQLANKKINILNKYNMKFSFITKYNPKNGVSFMSYDKTHTDDYCDKCNKKVGKSKLFKLPYVYCDKNDTMHEDVSYLIGMKNEGYRQYFVCIDCFRKEPK